MRKILMGLFAFAVAALTLIVARPAMANEFPAWDLKTVTAPGPSFETCENLKGWYVNNDENSADDDHGDRRPTPTVDGLQFEKNQLIHHAVTMDLKDVHPGTYAATPAPSLVDFFSIEVANPTAPVQYGTLRYNATGAHAGEWNIGGTSFYDTDVVKLATDHNRSTNAVSIGVGYVATPDDGTKTVVSSITFHGDFYSLTCKPVVTKPPTSKPTTKPTTKAPTKKATTSHAAGGAAAGGTGGTSGGALAITGPSTVAIVGGALALLVVGGGAFFLTRRRRVKFSA